MLEIIREMYEHQAWADSTLLAAVKEQAGAADDEEIRKLLHHVVLVQRAYLGMLWGWPFDMAKETQPPASFEELEARFREAHEEEGARVARVETSDLVRMVDVPYVQGMRFSVRQGLMQVVMHSHGHRAQCAARLRILGGKPPILDYILWVKDRPAAAS